MDKNDVTKALKKAKELSKKRNFNQSIELIVNLKGLNLKNPEQQVETFAHLHFDTGKKKKVCAFAGPELAPEAKKVCDKVITQQEFESIAKDKRAVKKLAREFDFFIAQANIMAQVASSFGRFLGPKGKMPNPKAGCVVPPKANLKPLYDNLQKTVKLTAKTQQLIQCIVGSEAIDDEKTVDNIMAVYNHLIHQLPNEENNVKSVFIKLTMGPSVQVGAKDDAQKKKAPQEKKEETEEKKAEEKPKEEVKEEQKAKEEHNEKISKSEKEEKKPEQKKEGKAAKKEDNKEDNMKEEKSDKE
ncbi:50S ribosomal protein L1 [Candidatus Woesearchaeota archaeon]|nr:MAG: 50S ribosomal protein L1 [Candidatus Woesearchaeota archaeon]